MAMTTSKRAQAREGLLAAANIKDVARVAGVSTATVSHTINNTRFVSTPTRQVVTAAMKELGYYPNLVARSLRNQKSRTIGLLIPDISNFYYTSVAQGVEVTLRKHGYNVILSNSHERTKVEAETIAAYNSLLLAGLIMIPALGDHGYLHKALSGTYPVVFVDRKPTGFEGDCVLLDNANATYEATKLFVTAGHRRIGLVTGDRLLSTTKNRIQGYKRALREAKVAVDECLIKAGEFSYQSGYTSTREVVLDGRATALFFASDLLAIGALTFLKEEGVKIPDEVAIISCNNFKWCEVTSPPLSVIEQPSYEVGQKAAEVLMSRITGGENSKTFKEYRIPTKIILRESFVAGSKR
jgi:LacI family transcriptional regulator